MKFVNLYEEVYANIDERRNVITFPQNFIPNTHINYTNLLVRTTLTGEYKYEGRKYRVARAMHPDFDLDGYNSEKTGSIFDVIEYKMTSRRSTSEVAATAVKGLAALANMKKVLPVQRKHITFGISAFSRHVDPSNGKLNIEKGDMILRPIRVFLNGDYEDTWTKGFTKTTTGSFSGNFIFRVDLYDRNTGLPTVSMKNGPGFICFFKDIAPADWTHFEVVSVFKNNNGAIVKPVVGSMKEIVKTILSNYEQHSM